MDQAASTHVIFRRDLFLFLAPFLPYLLTGNEQAYGILLLVGIFCPAFVGILISRVVSPAPDRDHRSKKKIAFLLTWALSTLIFTLNVHTTSGIDSPVAVVFYAIVGLLPAFVVSSAFSNFSEVRRYLSSLLRPRGRLGIYLFALLVIPAIRLVSVIIGDQLGLAAIYEPERIESLSRLLLLVAASSLYGLVFTGGLNEESGWTGFVLPRLQARFSPLTASVVLWLPWILWHMPMQVAGYWNSTPAAFVRALIGTFFARFIFTWLFNRTKGGMLAPMLFHVSANVCFAFLPATYVHMALEALLAVFVLIAARMWRKLPGGDSRGHASAAA